ncbi:LOW QUALITY PROTEIN: hypothetical protein CRUP_027025 [Coryphaenoides rupestris]|nr:LOW QUALITY PROTEIN: hypothetical protein CRUP_027025 [Coryphaenoides rupestris]
MAAGTHVQCECEISKRRAERSSARARDGIPPYKLATKKKLQREMSRSVKINGQGAGGEPCPRNQTNHCPRRRCPSPNTPIIPHTHQALAPRGGRTRLPKEMTPMEPCHFAAQLITRLEKLKREQDTRSTLEERLQQIQESLLPGGSGGQCDEDPQAILDEHLSRTPGCQSPGLVRYFLRRAHRSPDRTAASLPSAPGHLPAGRLPRGPKALVAGRPSTKHIHHHYVHHHAGPKTKGADGGRGGQRVHTLSKRPAKLFEEGMSVSHLPLDTSDRSQNVWQWILESERQGKHKPHSTQSLKKSHPVDSPTKTLPGRAHAPWGHPFIQDPAMPPLPPPNTLAQLEEACRRLEETLCSEQQQQQQQPSERQESFHSCLSQRRAPPRSKELMVTYFFCGEEIPYRSMMKSHSLTLGHFKEQLSKKGNYRYYFKKASDEFECGAVFEEVAEDRVGAAHGKILGKVEKMD